jgi:hypothetical protein
MRSIILLLSVLTASVASAAGPDIYGVWAAELPRCDFGGPAHFDRLSLSVTRSGKRLSIIEVAVGEVGGYISERQFHLGMGLRRAGNAEGMAKTRAGETVLSHYDRIERWSVSEDASELTVRRWVGSDHTARPQILVFRRSEATPE